MKDILKEMLRLMKEIYEEVVDINRRVKKLEKIQEEIHEKDSND